MTYEEILDRYDDEYMDEVGIEEYFTKLEVEMNVSRDLGIITDEEYCKLEWELGF